MGLFDSPMTLAECGIAPDETRVATLEAKAGH